MLEPTGFVIDGTIAAFAHACATQPADIGVTYWTADDVWELTHDTDGYRIQFCPFCGEHLPTQHHPIGPPAPAAVAR